MIEIDLTTIDEIDEEAVTSMTLDDFVPAVAALTQRKAARELAQDRSREHHEWEQ